MDLAGLGLLLKPLKVSSKLMDTNSLNSLFNKLLIVAHILVPKDVEVDGLNGFTNMLKNTV